MVNKNDILISTGITARLKVRCLICGKVLLERDNGQTLLSKILREYEEHWCETTLPA